jgi:hypothetical protein
VDSLYTCVYSMGMNTATMNEDKWMIIQGNKEAFLLEGKSGSVWIADCHRTRQLNRGRRSKPWTETLFAELDADGVPTGRRLISTITKVARKRADVWFYGAKYIAREGQGMVLAYRPVVPKAAEDNVTEESCCIAARRGNGHVFGCKNYRMYPR